MLPAKVIAGGQTGADLGGLRAAKILGIPTGGTMPLGFKTELGPRPWMRTQFGLVECGSPAYGYRTRLNAEAAHLTILFGDWRSVGSKRTIKEIGDRPLVINPSLDALQRLVESFPADYVVNIAGNRESGNPMIERYVTAHLVHAWAPYTTTIWGVPHTEAVRAKCQLAPYPEHGPVLPEYVR